MKYSTLFVSLACTLLAAVLAVAGLNSFAGSGSEDRDADTVWIADPRDSVCGLSDPRMLSRPAQLDHPFLMALTPEIKRIRDEGIDPNSPLGVMLRQHAVDRVQRAAEFVRHRDGYCSVWKRIRHRDGHAAPDVTEPVRQRL
jgi:hypothetical protein